MQDLETLRFMTTKRDHLIEMSQRLIEGIEPRFFHDPNQKILVMVDGAYHCGKSVMVDAAYELMFEGMKGGSCKEYVWHMDEWKKPYHGQQTYFRFANYSNFNLNGFEPGESGDQGKDCGGIEFAQNENSNRFNRPNRYTIDIWVEGIWNRKLPDTRFGNDKQLHDMLYRRMKKEKWSRYVELSVNKHALSDTPRFREAWNDLASRGKPIRDRFFRKRDVRLIK